MEDHEAVVGLCLKNWDQVVPLWVGPLALVSLLQLGSGFCELLTAVTCHHLMSGHLLRK